MQSNPSRLFTRLARTPEDIAAAQRVRYEVFVRELGSEGDGVDHKARLEKDHFDPHFEHLLLIDPDAPNEVMNGVVGVYRLLTGEKAEEIGQFYTEDEYDLSLLKASGRKLLELGRSCLLPAYRGGTGMYLLWNGLSEYVLSNGIEILFGVASFHSTNPDSIAAPLSLLNHRHLAPEDIRVRAVDHAYQPMDLVTPDSLDARAAMLATPALIKAYLRLGGFVGDGAYIDHEFKTTDVCLILDTARMNERQRAIYEKAGRA